MSERSNIAWTDGTHNFWRGCTKVSPGCQHCYAEKMVTTRLGGEWGKGKPRVRAKQFNLPLRWNKKPWVCDTCGKAFTHAETHMDESGLSSCRAFWHRRRVFSLSLGDWLDEEAPIEYLADMLSVIQRCTDLDLLLLTKRAQNWEPRVAQVLDAVKKKAGCISVFALWLSRWLNGTPPPNVWIGTSIENQATADERIPKLRNIPAACRFLSVEPMLGPIDFHSPASISGIHWEIFGGESGHNARPCNIEWIRDGVKQCRAAGVAPFVKQLGGVPYNGGEDSSIACCAGSYIKLKDSKGGDPAEWPIDLRVRTFPIVNTRQLA